MNPANQQMGFIDWVKMTVGTKSPPLVSTRNVVIWICINLGISLDQNPNWWSMNAHWMIAAVAGGVVVFSVLVSYNLPIE